MQSTCTVIDLCHGKRKSVWDTLEFVRAESKFETSLLKKWPHVQVSAKWKFNTIWAHILLLHCWVFWWFCENVIIDGKKAFPTLLHFLEWNIAAPNLVECSISFNSQLAKLQKYNFPFCSRNGDMIRDNCKKLTEKFR